MFVYIHTLGDFHGFTRFLNAYAGILTHQAMTTFFHIVH